MLKAITNVANGLDVAWSMRIRFDFGAKRRHASIDSAIIDHDVVSPHGIEKLIAGQGVAGTLGKEFQKPKLFRRESDLLAFSEKLARRKIQFAVSELKHIGFGGLTSAQECRGARQLDAVILGFEVVLQPAQQRRIIFDDQDR